ncbi:hypothetical protein L7F22_001594 [Adiantum nelumboides]|nr:hypothetical protein [Adiantum nelumboides]
MSFPTFNGAAGEDAQEFLDNLEIACLVTGRDDDATRCKNGDEGPSKRSTRSGERNDAVPPKAPPTEEAPSPKVTMEESAIRKKKEPAKGPAYKLQSDIELAIDLKKALEKRILNSKVELTLGEVLGIAKRKFHEEIIYHQEKETNTWGGYSSTG